MVLRIVMVKTVETVYQYNFYITGTVLIENLLDNKIMFEVQAPAFQKGHMFSKH